MLAAALLAALPGCSKTPASPSTGVVAPSGTIAIVGTIYDSLPSGNGAPLPGARVEVVYMNRRDLTPLSGTADSEGRFRIAGVRAAENLRIRVTKEGYDSAERVTNLESDATFDFALTPIRGTLSGTITETPPTDSMPVAGARLEILSGSNKGLTTASGGTGSYTFHNVWGEFDVSISSPNHETRIARAALGSSTRLDVQLTPKNPRARTSFSGDLCTVERIPPWHSCTAPLDRSHTVRVDRPGAITLAVDYKYVGDYYFNYLTLQLRRNGSVVVEKQFRTCCGGGLPTLLPDNVYGGAIQLTASAAGAYELRVFNFIADTKGGVQTTYRIDVDHPR